MNVPGSGTGAASVASKGAFSPGTDSPIGATAEETTVELPFSAKPETALAAGSNTSVPPAPTVRLDPSSRVLLEVKISVPAATVVPPLYVFAPVRQRVPEPAIVRPYLLPPSLMGAATIKGPEEFLRDNQWAGENERYGDGVGTVAEDIGDGNRCIAATLREGQRAGARRYKRIAVGAVKVQCARPFEKCQV